MSNEIISIDIGNKYTKVVVGNSKRVLFYDKALTPDGVFRDDYLQDINAASKLIKSMLLKRRVGTKNVCFVIHGRDIVVRHIEIPLMSMDKVGKAVVWEITQYLPELESDYYIDYQILNRLVAKKDNVYKVMVVAIPKPRADRYIQLANLMGLKVKCVDIAANSISRVFSGIYNYNKNLESIGILDIGAKKTSMSILDKGNLFIEREISMGINQMAEDFGANFTYEKEKFHEYFTTKFNFANVESDESAQGRIKVMFDNIMEIFNKIITFYRSGNYEKKLDVIYLIGAGCEVYGIEKYIKEYTGSEVKALSSIQDLHLKIQVPYGFDARFYSSCLGMLLRDATYGLNLLPDNMKKAKAYLQTTKKITMAAVLTGILVAGVTIALITYSGMLKRENDNLATVIASKSQVQKKNHELKTEKSKYESYLSKVEALTSNKIIASEKVIGLKNAIPNDVTFKAVTYIANNYTIAAETQNYNSISALAAKLQMSEEYANARIRDVNAEGGTYTFTIVIRGE
ncbi:pilus assembly protein PilM [Clostridium thermarum]|uniref:pilus assembly protein PilM n=1 Tax=Clostridium thermarum TaxID=1716543 RepID=UPI00111CC55C|nr:pilus assembly protein PilM [Clostridium thermarum]